MRVFRPRDRPAAALFRDRPVYSGAHDVSIEVYRYCRPARHRRPGCPTRPRVCRPIRRLQGRRSHSPPGSPSLLPGRRYDRRGAQEKARILYQPHFPQNALLDRASRSGASISRAHLAIVPCRRTSRRRDTGMRRDLYQGQGAGMPALPVRPAHDHRYRQHPPQRQVHSALYSGRI